MAVKFTPGPWRLEGPDGFGDYNVLESASDPVVAAVISNVRLASEVNANARLIASAPELLEALQGVLWMAEEWFKHGGDKTTFFDGYKESLNEARAAILKATGEA
jgi:hypothetical protein